MIDLALEQMRGESERGRRRVEEEEEGSVGVPPCAVLQHRSVLHGKTRDTVKR